MQKTGFMFLGTTIFLLVMIAQNGQAQNAADLAITLSSSANIVPVGGSFTLRADIQNKGTEPSPAGRTVSILVNSVLTVQTPLAAQPGGVSCQVVQGSTGISCSLPAINAAGSLTLSFGLGLSKFVIGGVQPCVTGQLSQNAISDTTFTNDTEKLCIGVSGTALTLRFPSGETAGAVNVSLPSSNTNVWSCQVASCGALFLTGTQIKASPQVNSGFFFTGWSGSNGSAAVCSGTGPCTFALNQATTVVANLSPGFPLVISLVGQGAVVATLANGTNALTCPTVCQKFILSGSQITLTAKPAKGYGFAGWSGGTGAATACGKTAPCAFTINTTSTLTATFQVAQ